MQARLGDRRRGRTSRGQRLLRTDLWAAARLRLPDGSYAQLDTGPTKLAFACYTLGESSIAGGVRRPGENEQPPNCELTLVADDVDAVYPTALRAGCTALAEPTDKPHGQRVAYVRDPFGTLLELGTPM